ncbi:unnamed protein product [Brassica rapa]|uniref:Uncharacterized protein n=1 Tax=Brassica campestris TaxID=3711 RepID=A0A8D9DB87_BRACM|nr:unnamed protein product [Brassica rapa]
MDSHGRPVCADGHRRTHTDTHEQPQTSIHGKGQRAESKDQLSDMCTDGKPRTSCVKHTDVLCMLTDTHGRPLCTEQTAHVGQNHPKSPREGPAC